MGSKGEADSEVLGCGRVNSGRWRDPVEVEAPGLKWWEGRFCAEPRDSMGGGGGHQAGALGL